VAEAERLAKEEAERKAEAKRVAEAERLAKEEAERKAEAKRKAEAERLAKELAERVAEANRVAQAERLAKEEEAERKAEADHVAETERLRKEVAERVVEAKRVAEAERFNKEEEEAERKAVAERLAKEEAERVAKAKRVAEAERLAKEKAERKAEADHVAEAERLAKQEAERVAEAKRVTEAERLANADAERKAASERSAMKVSATGDPHLANIYGERFDLMRPGHHVLIHIPRGERVGKTLLHVEADASQMGKPCTPDMYFQELNITGAWAEEKQAGGLHYFAQGVHDDKPTWEQFGRVELKVAHGLTKTGIKYLNLYVKHLNRAGSNVGGLLGLDDHTLAAKPSDECLRRRTALFQFGRPDGQVANGQPAYEF